MTQVQIGEQTVTVQRFKGLKAILVMAAMTRVGGEIPDIMADVARDYQKRNSVRVTEDMARLPRWAGFSKEDFDAAEAKSGERVINLPSPISQNEQVLAALPTLLEKARKEVIRLLAILIVPNDRLKEADETDKVEELLDEYKGLLLYDAELDQLADLLLTAREVLADQLSDRGERLGKMIWGLVWAFRKNLIPSPTLSEPASRENDESSTSPTLSDDAPSSSTPSETPMDGTELTPSMASPIKS